MQNLEEFKFYIKRGRLEEHGQVKVKITENGFIIDRSTFYGNRNKPPQICGSFSQKDGKDILTLTILSQNSAFILMIIMPLFILISTIFTGNLMLLFLVPFGILFYYILGLLIHLSMIKKTMKVMHEVLKMAGSYK